MNDRQFKFRAWDKLEKRFIYPDKGYQGHYVLDLNGRFHNLQNGSGGDEYVVQQFTGFNDVYMKEIYEGDIIEFYWGENTKNKKLAKVEFIGSAYFARIINPTNTLSLTWMNHWIDSPEKLEVIGNIYETPELLK